MIRGVTTSRYIWKRGVLTYHLNIRGICAIICFGNFHSLWEKDWLCIIHSMQSYDYASKWWKAALTPFVDYKAVLWLLGLDNVGSLSKIVNICTREFETKVKKRILWRLNLSPTRSRLNEKKTWCKKSYSMVSLRWKQENLGTFYIFLFVNIYVTIETMYVYSGASVTGHIWAMPGHQGVENACLLYQQFTITWTLRLEQIWTSHHF